MRTNEIKLCELEKELGKYEEEASALHRRKQLLEGANKQTEETVFTKGTIDCTYTFFLARSNNAQFSKNK